MAKLQLTLNNDLIAEYDNFEVTIGNKTRTLITKDSVIPVFYGTIPEILFNLAKNQEDNIYGTNVIYKPFRDLYGEYTITTYNDMGEIIYILLGCQLDYVNENTLEIKGSCKHIFSYSQELLKSLNTEYFRGIGV